MDIINDPAKSTNNPLIKNDFFVAVQKEQGFTIDKNQVK